MFASQIENILCWLYYFLMNFGIPTAIAIAVIRKIHTKVMLKQRKENKAQ